MNHNRLLGVLALMCATVSLYGDQITGKLDVYWPDVEGGAATLIVTPSGESLLIDTGMPGGRDPGRILALAKDKAKLTRIDYLVTTHMHIDHFGGAAEVAAQLPIGTVFDNGIPDEDPDGNKADRTWVHRSKPYREMQVGARKVIQAGEFLPLKAGGAGGRPSLTVRCVAARQQMATLKQAHNPLCDTPQRKETDTSDNANSIVLLIRFGSFELFIGGDLTWNVEEKLICPSNVVGTVDVMQMNHHGLDVSNNPLLVNALAPTVAVMSNGTEKGCGAETFATLKKTASVQAIYQIHKNLRKDSENNTATEYIANLDKQCTANPIQLAVDPDGKNYTLSIPAKGHKRTFQTH